MRTALLACVLLVSGCGSYQSHASPNCSVAVTTTRQEANPVYLPPANGYPGKRPVPTVAYPDIPINKAMIDC